MNIFTSEVETFAYTNEIDFKNLVQDLIFFESKIINILNIINQFLIDKPTTIYSYYS